jgi:hypothetical protein
MKPSEMRPLAFALGPKNSTTSVVRSFCWNRSVDNRIKRCQSFGKAAEKPSRRKTRLPPNEQGSRRTLERNRKIVERRRLAVGIQP